MSILKMQENIKNSLSKEGERFLLFPSSGTKAEKKVSLKPAAYQLSHLRSASQCLTPVALPLKVKTVLTYLSILKEMHFPSISKKLGRLSSTI